MLYWKVLFQWIVPISLSIFFMATAIGYVVKKAIKIYGMIKNIK